MLGAVDKETRKSCCCFSCRKSTGKVAIDQSKLAISISLKAALGSPILEQAVLAITANRGQSMTAKADHDHAIIAKFCAPKSVIFAFASADRAAIKGLYRNAKEANDQARLLSSRPPTSFFAVSAWTSTSVPAAATAPKGALPAIPARVNAQEMFVRPKKLIFPTLHSTWLDIAAKSVVSGNSRSANAQAVLANSWELKAAILSADLTAIASSSGLASYS
mmetsp:Transcript_3879/g.6825  ORF Transcript_3879/g.6825 Transcript_3879/m.6825 type:complete len:220 (-) Transcript_3879:832-1491(-)